MNLQSFKLGLTFKPGHLLHFRDHVGGRIKVHDHTGRWIATLAPNFDDGCEVTILSLDHPSGEYEWRCKTWGKAQTLISILQQEGWEAADDAYYNGEIFEL